MSIVYDNDVIQKRYESMKAELIEMQVTPASAVLNII